MEKDVLKLKINIIRMSIANRMKMMTILDKNHNLVSENSLWNEKTLRPPLKIKECIVDLQYHWKNYHKSKIGAYRQLLFLTLMIYQRVSYNIGWLISKFKSNRKELNYLTKK